MNVLTHVPLTVPSSLVTARSASAEQLSEIVRPFVRRYSSVFVAGAAVTSQPVTVNAASVPVIAGASSSFTVTVCSTVVKLLHLSVTL